MTLKIAIGCPVRNRAWVLPGYLKALDAIDYPDKQYIFYENDSTDISADILRDFIHEHPNTWAESIYNVSKPEHTRAGYSANNYGHLANIRNHFIDMFLCGDADYLLSIDSDIIVPPDTIAKLLPLADNKTIVGAAISNIPGRDLDGHVPGNFMISQGDTIIHPPEYPITGTVGVDVVGAVYLMPRKVLEDGVRYGAHWQGEDVAFCQQAKDKGYKLLVNMDCRPEHRMVEE
jgi:GT2 family glycosyltransferase